MTSTPKDPLYPRVTDILKSYDMGWLEYFYKAWGTVSHQSLTEMGVDVVNTVDLANNYARSRAESGTRVHLAWEFLADDKLEEAMKVVEERERDTVYALARWKQEAGVTVLAREKHVRSEIYKYQGQLDNIVEIEKTGWITEDFWHNPIPEEFLLEPVRAILDLKTKDGGAVESSQMKKHGMQQAAYDAAEEEEHRGEVQSRDLGIVLEADIETATITPHVIVLNNFWLPFLWQRSMYDFIKSYGKYDFLRKRKTKTKEAA